MRLDARKPAHDRLQVHVVDFLAPVREVLELGERAIELLRVDLVPQVLEPLAQHVASAVLSEDQARRGEADVLGAHDLVGLGVLEHAVLVDSGLVGERVLAYYGLVALHDEPCRLRDDAARFDQLLGADGRVETEMVGAGAHRHHHFLERAVAGALADPVDGAFDLPRARFQRGQGVRDGEAEIVVAVHAERHALDPADGLAQMTDERAELVRQRVPDGVGNVDGRRPGGDRALDHLGEEVGLGAGCVLGGVLDVVEELARVRDALLGAARHLFARHVQLVLAVERARREEDVAAPAARVAERRFHLIDIALLGAGQRTHGRTLDLAGDGRDGLEVSRRSGREARFDDVDVKALQRAGDADLLMDVHARARRLLAVAQRGVEDYDAVRRPVHAATSSACVPGTATFVSPPRSMAMAPVRTTSATPKGLSTSRSPSIRSCPPVISRTMVAGERSTIRARNASQMRSTSLRWWSGA